MAYTFADRFMDSLDEIRRGLRGWTKGDHTQYYPVACYHNENCLALYNGSLMSVIRINGYMGQYFPEEFAELSKQWAKFLQTATRDKSAKGFDIFWSYEYDPTGVGESARALRSRMIKASERRGLNVRDILEEEADLYGKYCALEEQYLIVVTHIDSLPKADQGDALKRSTADRSKAMRGSHAMNPQLGVKGLEATHSQHVNKIMVFLKQAMMGYSFDRLSARDALWAMRHSYTKGTTGPGWKARLTLNDSRFRSTDELLCKTKDAQGKGVPGDWSSMLPPPLAEQMVPDGAVDLGKYVVVDGRTYAPMHISELAVDPQPIENLLSMCYERKLPVRIVYSLMANHDQANYWNRWFASIFSFASASNRQINKADKAMKAYHENQGAIFGYGVSITTWADTKVTYDGDGQAFYNVEELQRRAQDIETLVQQWGGQQVETVFGCSIEALMGATPGYAIPPSCPKAPQIEYDIISQLPIMRPARIWEPDNAIWMRSSDGVLLPYQPFSNKQNAMLTLVMGGMGYGKSNLMSEHIHYFANHPEADEMPYIRGIDFGASSSGVIDMIRDSLPEDRKHEALFETFTNDGSLVKNMLDTRLGLLYPLEDHSKFLVSWILLLCDELVASAGGVSNIVAIASASLKRAYETKDPNSQYFEPVYYNHATAPPLVQAAVDRIEHQIDDRTNYREIVEALIENGLRNNDKSILHAAKIAQRKCVPLFSDLVQSCSSLTEQFKNMPEVDGRNLVDAMTNALTNANALFPCFTGETNTDISESRICVFDMSEAFGRGTSAYDDWIRAVYFSIAYRLLNEDLFINRQSSGEEMKLRQQSLGMSERLLHWYHAYLDQQDQLIKMFWADELHRIGKVRGAFAIIDSMAYEGRKYRVGIMLGTQMPRSFPEDILKLASSYFIFGASQSSENAKDLQDLFDLSDDERQVLLDMTKPTAEKGAEVFVIHKTTLGVQRLKLHFQMGNIKRWAFATEPEERGLRRILYAEGPSSSWTRMMLAKRVPDINKAIASHQARYNGELSRSEAIRRIADDVLKLAHS